ncbi:MAG: hypothetical protein ABIK98_06045 [Pseudomonadota bacterium]|uniref:Uncharacterized protein n=1 Tax=Candidatus Desulfatibia profunda TaxID=2841695 RepID=A0A8J6NQU1_9BACT|nr:hypothetical protein [Candidatus Desulfatibia profunda]MBU0699126.1 hypothetical protein [Pseudomonadota bacterium]
MKRSKLIGILFIVALLAWGGEIIYLAQQNAATPDRIKAAENQRRNRADIEYQKKLRALEQDYDKKKHLATGKTVFDRIYNSPGQVWIICKMLLVGASIQQMAQCPARLSIERSM